MKRKILAIIMSLAIVAALVPVANPAQKASAAVSFKTFKAEELVGTISDSIKLGAGETVYIKVVGGVSKTGISVVALGKSDDFFDPGYVNKAEYEIYPVNSSGADSGYSLAAQMLTIDDTYWDMETFKTKTLEAGKTMYFRVTNQGGGDRYFCLAGIGGNMNPALANSMDSAIEIDLENPETQITSGGVNGWVYYKYTAPDKRTITVNQPSYSMIQIKDAEGNNVEMVDYDDASPYTFNVEKGETVYLIIIGCSGNTITASIGMKNFNEITKLSPKSAYGVAKNSSDKITIPVTKENASKAIDSSISYYYDSDCNASSLIIKKTGASAAYITAKDLPYEALSIKKGFSYGKLKIYAKTSEGLKAAVTVMVAPEYIPASKIQSVGTCTSSKVSAKVTGVANSGYMYYKASTKGGTYKLVKTTTASEYNLTKLKANSSCYVKVVRYITVDGKKYSGSVSSAAPVKVVTAPNKAPKITYLKCTASKYYPKHTEQQKYWELNDPLQITHYRTVTVPAYSKVSAKVKFTSVSGASGYDQSTNIDKKLLKHSTIKSGSIFTGEKSGRVTSSNKLKTKVRAYKKSGTSIAYGPWSAVKTVSCKRAK